MNERFRCYLKADLEGSLDDSFGERPREFEKTLIKPWVWHPNLFCKLLECENFTFVSYKDICSHIVHLSFVISPAAIGGLIVAVIINTVDAHAFWGLAHIFEEKCVILPALADCYSSSSVIFIGFIFNIIAAPMNSLPNAVSSSFISHPMCSGKTNNLLVSDFTPPAPTGLAYISGELVFANKTSIATVTTTLEEPAIDAGKDKPAIEFQSNYLHHRRGL